MNDKETRAMVFFGNASAFVDAANILYREHNFIPVFWSGASKHKTLVESMFDKVDFYDPLIHGIYSKLPESMNLELSYRRIDPKLIRDLAFSERVYMEMIYTRADPGGGFSFYEVRKIYYEYLVFSFSLLEEYQPDVIIFDTTPHMMWDYVLYIVAKHCRINVIIFNDTPFPGRMVVFRDLDPCLPAGNYRHKEDAYTEESVVISPDVKSYIESLKKDFRSGAAYTFKAELLKGNVRAYMSSAEISKRLKKNKKSVISAVRREKWKELLNKGSKNRKKHYLKQSGVAWSYSFQSTYSFQSQRLADIDKRMELLANYDSHSCVPDLNAPYVYFPLHWQPENSTVPMGGLFSDLHLALTLLREAIPDNWKIYIKENPGQFEWHRGSFARHEAYYDEMASIEGVTLVNTESDSYDLIDYSKCVFTITGTTGWEAIVRGKPVLIAGNCVWYTGAPNLHRVRSLADIEKAIQHIQGQSVNSSIGDLDKFILEFIKKSYFCVIDPAYVDELIGDKKKNTDEIVRAVINNL